MITRDFLLHNNFEFRVWDDSKMPEGEYVLRGDGWIIRIGWSRMFAWDLSISNFDELILVTADRQEKLSIEQLRKMLEVANVELKLIEK